jgi:hypothetical protein
MPHQRKNSPYHFFVAHTLVTGCSTLALSKTNTKDIIGTAGVRDILYQLGEAGYTTRTVCIGGVNASNVQRIIFQTQTPKKTLDGVAVVSAVIGAPDPEEAASNLLNLIKTPYPLQSDLSGEINLDSPFDVTTSVEEVVQMIHETTPLSHNITNLVCNSALFHSDCTLISTGGPKLCRKCGPGYRCFPYHVELR